MVVVMVVMVFVAVLVLLLAVLLVVMVFVAVLVLVMFFWAARVRALQNFNKVDAVRKLAQESVRVCARWGRLSRISFLPDAKCSQGRNRGDALAPKKGIAALLRPVPTLA
jgi:hypothetical protein